VEVAFQFRKRGKKRMPKTWVVAGKIQDFEEGKGKEVKVQGQAIAIFRIDQKFYGIENACYHQGSPLHDGDVKDCVVTCPAHSWKFRLESGECTRDDSIVMRTYSVKAENDDVLILI